MPFSGKWAIMRKGRIAKNTAIRPFQRIFVPLLAQKLFVLVADTLHIVTKSPLLSFVKPEDLRAHIPHLSDGVHVADLIVFYNRI